MSYLGSMNPYMTPEEYAKALRQRQMMLQGGTPQAPQMSPNPQPGPQMSPNREPTREERLGALIRRGNIDTTAADNELKRQKAYANSLMATKSAGPRQLGNVVVNNPWEGLEVGFNRALGGYLAGKAREKDEAMQAKRDDRAAALSELAAFKLENELDQQDIANMFTGAQLAADAADDDYTQDKDLTTWEQNARRDFIKETGDFKQIDDAYGKIIAASDPENQTAQTQMSLIFGYMKLLDPGSTVREGEFATAEQTTGIPGRIVNLYNRAESGEFLDPDQVAGFAAAAGDIYKNYLDAFDQTSAYYTELAEDRGAKVENVVRDRAMFRGFDAERPPNPNDPPPKVELVKPPTTSQELWDRMSDEQKRQVMQAAGMVP